jgi:hypothetical protein
MATTQYSSLIREYQELIRREDRRGGRHRNEDGVDPFDKVSVDEDEIDEFALYRLGVK